MAGSDLYETGWEGIPLLIRWAPNWHSRDVAHLEIESVDRVPLPITGSGYRSHFTAPELIHSEGGPVAFATAWLDLEAMSPQWKAYELASRQLSLF